MFRNSKTIAGTMVLMMILIFVACPAAFGSSDVDIYTGANLVDNLTTDELNAYGTFTETYSTCKCNGNYYTYSPTGASLDEVLRAVVGTNYASTYSKIEFICTDDSYSSGVLDLDDVLNGCFFSSKTDPTGDLIEAMIATSGDANCLRNFYGQQVATDKAIEGWVNDLDKIVLSN